MWGQSLAISHRQTNAKPVPEQKMGNFLELPVFPFYCCAWCHMARNISLVSSGHLLCCEHSQPIAHPQSIPWEGKVRNREGPDAVQTLFSNR